MLALALLLLLAAGCGTGQSSPPDGTMPVVQIVGADLRHIGSPEGPVLEVSPKTREVDRVLAPPCSPLADCIDYEAANEILVWRTRLVANHPVRVRGRRIEPGTDLIAALGGFAYLQLGVYPFATSRLPIRDLELTRWRTRLTASWETDDGLAFSSSVTVRR